MEEYCTTIKKDGQEITLTVDEVIDLVTELDDMLDEFNESGDFEPDTDEHQRCTSEEFDADEHLRMIWTRYGQGKEEAPKSEILAFDDQIKGSWSIAGEAYGRCFPRDSEGFSCR